MGVFFFGILVYDERKYLRGDDGMKDKKNVFYSVNLLIENNIMQWNNSAVQLSNITALEIARMPKKSYPLWALAGFLVGFTAMFLNDSAYVLAGILTMLIFGSVIYFI